MDPFCPNRSRIGTFPAGSMYSSLELVLYPETEPKSPTVVAKMLDVELGKASLNLMCVSSCMTLGKLFNPSKPQLPSGITVKPKYSYRWPLHQLPNFLIIYPHVLTSSLFWLDLYNPSLKALWIISPLSFVLTWKTPNPRWTHQATAILSPNEWKKSFMQNSHFPTPSPLALCTIWPTWSLPFSWLLNPALKNLYTLKFLLHCLN